MVNKALRIVLYSIFTISLLFVVPFNNIHADTITTSNITYNYYLTDVVDSTSQLANKDYIYDVDFVFDKSYLGWVSVSMITSYIFATGDTRQATYTKAIYVNGNTAKTSIVISSNFNGANGSPLSSMSITVNNSNVTPLADLSSLQDIIDLLQDIDDHISINVLDELETIASNIGLSNTYLNNIDDNLENIDNLIDKISWVDIPVELSYRVNLSDTPTPWTSEIGRLNGYLSFSYTRFFTFDSIIKIYLPVNYGRSLSDIRLYFDNGEDVTDEYLLYITRSRIGVVLYMISETNYGYYGTGTINVKANYNYVYAPSGNNGVASVKYLPSDDIEYWQLKSFFINDKYMNIIANGTNDSSAASSQSDLANSQLQQDSNTLFTQEDSFKQNMNSAMQNIDTTFTLNNFGQSFMTSAQWVRTQYETLTNNTPFASLITFSLLVGLALIVIGKVYK